MRISHRGRDARRRRFAAAARQRLTAGGQRAARRQDYEAAARLFERAAALLACPRSTSPSKSSWARSCSGQADARRDCGVRMLSSSGLAAGDRVAEPAEGSAPTFSATTSSRRPHRGPGDTSRAGATRARGRGRRPCSLHRIFGARGNRRFAWAPGRHSGGVRASLYPCTAGGLSTSSMFAIRAWCRLAGTTAGNCLLGSTSTSPRQAGSVLPRLPCLVAGQARAVRRSAGHRRRCAGRAGGAWRGAAREPECLRVRLDRTWRRDPAAAAEFGANGCRMHEELGEHRFLGSAAGVVGAGALCTGSARRRRRLGRSCDADQREHRRVGADALAPGEGEGARA